MKLLYITNGITGVGGLERVLSLKSSYLADFYNYEVTILSLNEGGVKPYYDYSQKVKFKSIEVKGGVCSYFKSYFQGIKMTIKQENPDKIIVCDDGLKAFFLPILFRKKKFIYERHVSKKIIFQNEMSIRRRALAHIQIFFMNILSRYFEFFIVLNEGNKKEWKYKRNLKVIGNPLSFYPEQSARLNNFRAIAVGKQSFQKNYERMINLWANVTSKHPRWELHIYGKSEPNLNLNGLIKKLYLDKNIFLHNPIKNIQSKYLESSIFLMSSRFEGMPMVMLEAMSCGLPIVSFDSPHGPRELIDDGINGFLIEYKDDEKYIEKIFTLIENKNKRIELGQNSRQKSLDFSIPRTMKKWDKLFNNKDV